ncbi:MAG: hypothetical protein JSU65_11430, partial [Candidatus Zixiibacteriota bacterium]
MLRYKVKEQKVKRVTLFAILALAILAGSATSQVHLVSFESITNVQDDTLLVAGNTHVISLRVTNTDTSLYNTANGFRIFSDDGATWTTMSGAWLNSFDDLFIRTYINPFGVDGAGSDTIGFAGVSFGPPEGLPPGYDALAYEITIGPTFKADHMKKICLDSSYYPPGGVWKWAPLDATPQVYPDWSGQKCWTVFDPDAPTTVLMVEPQLLEFTAEEGGPNPA